MIFINAFKKRTLITAEIGPNHNGKINMQRNY